jgi:hypothetical protein
MARTVASRKAKGRRLQTTIVKKILQVFNWLSESDVRSTPMGCTGEDIWLSKEAKKVFPFSVEAKNTEKLNIWQSLKQAENPLRKETPLLIFKKNNSKIYCALEFDYFLDLIVEAYCLNEELNDLNINKKDQGVTTNEN